MFEKLISFENLLLAFRKAAKGKRSRSQVALFEHDLERNLWRLQEELKLQTYRPGKYVSFYIHEPKRRLISAAPFRDRVIHHALCNMTEPVFERSFIHDSYANRICKGTHRALDRCQYFSRRFPFVLQCDIKQFFPAIDHEILLRKLAAKIVDEKVLWLAKRILQSGEGVLDEVYNMTYFGGDDLFAANRPRGLPIGNLTSQFWANVYLNSFDHFVKRQLRCAGYLRYVDDFMLFSDSKKVLWQAKYELAHRLSGLRLALHPAAQPRPVVEGVPFLGFVIFPNKRRLKRRKGIHFGRKLRAMKKAVAQGELTTADLSASVVGWVNHVRFANTTGLRKAVLGAIANR